MSDIDVAIWFDPGLDSRSSFDLQLSLIGEAARALRTDEVDVVPLNNAPPLMRHRAIREGKRLVERHHDERVRLETRAILDFLDTAPLRAELGRGVRRRMKEGRLVDVDRVEARIQRLEELIERPSPSGRRDRHPTTPRSSRFSAKKV